MSERRRINSILVCGSGLVGLSAAVAFARALPHANVRLLTQQQDPGAIADRMPGTLPAVRFFHKLIGIDESRLFRYAGATHRIGTRFEHWGADGATWFDAFGRFGVTVRSSPFHHQWVRMHSKRRALPFDQYAPATALARSDKFIEPANDQRSLLSSFDYALRLDPHLYRGLLADEAARARVILVKGDIGEVRQIDGRRVKSVVLTDGRSLEADLFIDCTGPSGKILSRVDNHFEDWSGYLPCDRLVLCATAPTTPTPTDTVTATHYGWNLAIPLLSRTIRAAAYSSALTNDNRPQEAVQEDANNNATELICFRPGRKSLSWVGNVIAFGDSATVIDPLQSTNLTIAQSGIRRAISLLDDTNFHPLLIDEFNRRTRLETDRVRDFVSLHYVCARRTSGEFWGSMADLPISESLRHTLDEFERRGRLPKYDEETFDDNSWLAVLFGLGVIPRRIDPTVYRVPETEVETAMKHVARVSAELPSSLPCYADYIEKLGGSR